MKQNLNQSCWHEVSTLIILIGDTKTRPYIDELPLSSANRHHHEEDGISNSPGEEL